MSELGIDEARDVTSIDGVDADQLGNPDTDAAEAKLDSLKAASEKPQVTAEDLQAGGNEYANVLNPAWLQSGVKMPQLVERAEEHSSLLEARLATWAEVDSLARQFAAEDDALDRYERGEARSQARGRTQKWRKGTGNGPQPTVTPETERKRQSSQAWNKWVGINEALAEFANEVLAWAERNVSSLLEQLNDPERTRRISELRAELAALEGEAAESERVRNWLRLTAGQSPMHQGRQRVQPLAQAAPDLDPEIAALI